MTLGACLATQLSGTTYADMKYQGCWLRAAKGIGVLEEPTRSSGIDGLDDFCRQEVGNLEQMFGVSPTLLFYNDSAAPNALATPEPYDPAKPDGTVLLGKTLIAELFNKYRDSGALPVVAVIAHEWGHILQFKNSFSSNWSVEYELSADNGAGWYLAKSRGIDTVKSSEKTLATMFSEMGSTNFNNFNFHGSPAQRRNQILSGSGLLDSVVLPKDRIAKTARDALGLSR